ncbi:NAD(P)-dependent oxidoreductase [Flexistipes sp.]|uniref:NAD(P)-dependent oxidoreductase n=1 Tax=Flexistipes sp. TaxID=3088135 RepID=UPI002E21EBB7|nr:NAD(P)-dependent oxidoreductase [Flexistipes sp.]
MIIGSGQIAKAFLPVDTEDVLIFASGVANSKCKDKNEFIREEKLLKKNLELSENKKFVYFSSCVLSAKDYPLNEYYLHKQNMESIIRTKSDNYYIIRLPQLIGNIFKEHNTLFNFLYHKIINEESFFIYKNGFRYVIEVSDVRLLTTQFIYKMPPRQVINFANPYRYSIFEIVNAFEKILNKKAYYKVIDKHDSYYLNLESMKELIKNFSIKVYFSKKYLEEKLKKKLI